MAETLSRTRTASTNLSATNSSRPLEGKLAIITGASRGRSSSLLQLHSAHDLITATLPTLTPFSLPYPSPTYTLLVSTSYSMSLSSLRPSSLSPGLHILLTNHH